MNIAPQSTHGRDGCREVRADVDAERLALLFAGWCELAVTLHWGSDGRWPKLDEIPDLVTSIFLEGAGERS